MAQSEQRTSRLAHERGRLLTWVMLAALLAASLAPFLITRNSVAVQERQLLHEKSDDTGDEAARYFNTLRTSLRSLGGVLQVDQSEQTFLRNSRPLLGLGGFDYVGFVDLRSAEPKIVYKVGEGPNPGESITGETAELLRSRNGAQTSGNTGVVQRSEARLGFIQGGPVLPPGFALYGEIGADSTDAWTANKFFGESNSETDSALYATNSVDPSQLIISTTSQIPLTGDTYSEVMTFGYSDWTLVTRANTPMVSAFSRTMPWILLLGGVLVSFLTFFLARFFLRARDEAVQRARERDEEQLAILDAAREGFLSVNEKGEVLRMSRQSEVLFGWSQSEVVGRPIAETILPPTVMDAFDDDLQEMLAGGDVSALSHRTEIEAMTKDGRRIPIEVALWTGRRDGQLAYKALIHDISDRRAAARALERAHDAALDASRLKSEFLANMSHEIRTPMNGVIGMTDLLLRTGLSGEQREYAETVRNSGEALLTVINDILDFSKIEAGKLHLEYVDFDIRSTVEDTVELISERAESKGLEVLVDIAADVPMTANGDPGRIRQVLLNLVANAVKFTDVGEVVVRCRAVNEGDSTRIFFEVADTGIGIADGHQETLFESFRQVDMSSSRRHEGTGLGLTIARQLCHLMGGSISMTSRFGEGSTFYFDVLVNARKASDVIESQALIDVRGSRVLIIDDNETNRRIVCELASSWEMRPQAVGTGDAAVTELQSALRAGDPYNVALLDFHMPDEDGLALARRITATKGLAGIPMVLLTSSGDLLSQATLKNAGLSSSLTKPIRQHALKQRIMTSLNGPQEVSVEGASYDDVSLNGARVLLAEDNPVNQRVASLILERCGCVVDVARTGLQAVEAAQKQRYAIVFMDCQMPELDGYEAARRIREFEGDYRVPIVALTASAMRGDREKALEAGMDDHLPKPVRANELQAAVRHWAILEASPSSADEYDTPNIDAFDSSVIESLRTALGPQQEEQIETLIDQFVDHTRGELDLITTYVEDGNFNQIGQSAHKLKGSSGTLGAKAVALECAALQRAADSRDQYAVSQAFAALQDQVRLAIEEANAMRVHAAR